MKQTHRAKIEFKKTKAGGQKGAWRYAVKGANGEVLVASEGYTTKQDAERGLIALAAALSELTWVVLALAVARLPKAANKLK